MAKIHTHKHTRVRARTLFFGVCYPDIVTSDMAAEAKRKTVNQQEVANSKPLVVCKRKQKRSGVVSGTRCAMMSCSVSTSRKHT